MMNLQKNLRGTPVDVGDMMYARDHRKATQEQLLAQYDAVLVSFTLNIMGAVKDFPWARIAFAEGFSQVEQALAPFPILHCQTWRHYTGNEGFFVVDGALEGVKSAMVTLEERHPLGRLWDIDVLEPSGRKCSRGDLGFGARSCLLCERPAFVCSRSRSHSLAELLEKTVDMIATYFHHKYAQAVAQCALDALLFEVEVTPKAGLVDQRNNGAHRDMTIDTFRCSAYALYPYFRDFVTLGLEVEDVATLFSKARTLGRQAESAMFVATSNVNTHKGTIFLMGCTCCALGYLKGQNRPLTRTALAETIAQLTAEVERDFAALSEKTDLTHGETLYVQHGYGGARQEVMAGIPHLFQVGLPMFEGYLTRGKSANDAGVLTLLQLLATMDDTNIISRTNLETFLQVKAQCQAMVADPTLETGDYMGQIMALDDQFITQNISAGGCADLLALTHFLWQVEGL